MLKIAKSNKLFCSRCKLKIIKGSQIDIEYSDYGVIINILCDDCHDAETDVWPDDDDNLFSSDGLGQL
jgi:hypothetical protein